MFTLCDDNIEKNILTDSRLGNTHYYTFLVLFSIEGDWISAVLKEPLIGNL